MYFVSDTFKRVLKIKDFHTTPVPTLLSMAIDPFLEIFILCRCFFISQLDCGINLNKTGLYAFMWVCVSVHTSV